MAVGGPCNRFEPMAVRRHDIISKPVSLLLIPDFLQLFPSASSKSRLGLREMCGIVSLTDDRRETRAINPPLWFSAIGNSGVVFVSWSLLLHNQEQPSVS